MSENTAEEPEETTAPGKKARPRGCAGLFFLLAVFAAAGAGISLGVFLFYLRDVEATIATLGAQSAPTSPRTSSSGGGSTRFASCAG